MVDVDATIPTKDPPTSSLLGEDITSRWMPAGGLPNLHCLSAAARLITEHRFCATALQTALCGPRHDITSVTNLFN